MTEKEAMNELKFDNEKCLEQCEGACTSIKNHECNCQDAVIERMLDELLQYRKFGTVEEFRKLAVIDRMAEKDELAKATIEEWLEYRKIGSIEEYQKAIDCIGDSLKHAMTLERAISFLQEEIKGLEEQRDGQYGDIAKEVFEEIHGEDRISTFRTIKWYIEELQRITTKPPMDRRCSSEKSEDSAEPAGKRRFRQRFAQIN